MYADDEDYEDLTSYFTIKAIKEKKSRLFRAQGKEFQLNIKTFPNNVCHINSYRDCLISWLKTLKKDARWNPMTRCE